MADAALDRKRHGAECPRRTRPLVTRKPDWTPDYVRSGGSADRTLSDQRVNRPPEHETPWPLHFGHGYSLTIEPQPAREDSPYDALERDVVYTFTQELLPNFLAYDQRLEQPCFEEVTTEYVSEADVLAALAKSRDVRLRTAIEVEGEYGAVRVLAVDYTTSRRYDLYAMYETVVNEGNERCKR